MTTNAIAYLNYLEEVKHNRASEGETKRANLAKEGLTAQELAEKKRTNKANEDINTQRNAYSLINTQTVAQTADKDRLSKESVDYAKIRSNDYNAQKDRDSREYTEQKKIDSTDYNAQKNREYNERIALEDRKSREKINAANLSTDLIKANISAAASRYGSDASASASRYNADKHAEASKYTADKHAEASKYAADSQATTADENRRWNMEQYYLDNYGTINPQGVWGKGPLADPGIPLNYDARQAEITYKGIDTFVGPVTNILGAGMKYLK